MKGSLGLCSLVAVAMLLPLSQTFAQSGVVSGPPQIQATPGGPGPRVQGPGPGPRVQGPGPGPRVQGPGGEVWIAVVAGFDGSGRRVSVGYSGHQRSKFEAEDAAIKACHRSDSTVSCRNPLAVSNGCLYIVPGNKGDGGVRWGRGGTREAAFEECRRGGYVCPNNKLIGGCVPGQQ